MIGFEPTESKALGSKGRFYRRIQKFRDKGSVAPRTQHYFWWVVHNAVAHGVLALMPVSLSFRFHDWTSRKLNAE